MAAAIETYSRIAPNIVHVLPDEDLVEHSSRGLTCVCGPKTSVIDGYGWLVNHRALDRDP